MDYKQKEIEMIKALDSDNCKDMFDTKNEGLDFIAKHLESFPNYVNSVVKQQIMTPIWHNRFEGQELRDHIMEADSRRRSAHNVAIDSINILNRLCTRMGLEPFADIDTSDRYAVADFAGMWTAQMYNNGIGKTMDEVTYGRESEFKDNTKERINEAYQKLQNQKEHLDDVYQEQSENDNDGVEKD